MSDSTVLEHLLISFHQDHTRIVDGFPALSGPKQISFAIGSGDAYGLLTLCQAYENSDLSFRDFVTQTQSTGSASELVKLGDDPRIGDDCISDVARAIAKVNAEAMWSRPRWTMSMLFSGDPASYLPVFEEFPQPPPEPQSRSSEGEVQDSETA